MGNGRGVRLGGSVCRKVQCVKLRKLAGADPWCAAGRAATVHPCTLLVPIDLTRDLTREPSSRSSWTGDGSAESCATGSNAETVPGGPTSSGCRTPARRTSTCFPLTGSGRTRPAQHPRCRLRARSRSQNASPDEEVSRRPSTRHRPTLRGWSCLDIARLVVKSPTVTAHPRPPLTTTEPPVDLWRILAAADAASPVEPSRWWQPSSGRSSAPRQFPS